MSEEDLEVLITLDETQRILKKRIPSTSLRLTIPSRIGPVSRCQQGGDTTSELKALLIMTPPSWMGESRFYPLLSA